MLLLLLLLFFSNPHPDDHSISHQVDKPHNTHLPPALLDVLLLNTYRVYPEGNRNILPAQLPQRRMKMGRHAQGVAVYFYVAVEGFIVALAIGKCRIWGLGSWVGGVVFADGLGEKGAL